MQDTVFIFQWTSFSLAISIATLTVVFVLCWLACRRGGFRAPVVALESLRFSIVALAVLLLNQPETVWQFKPLGKPTVVILGDKSRSGETQDVGLDDTTSTPLLKRSQVIDSLLDKTVWRTLQDKLEVVVTGFDHENDGTQTDLHRALATSRAEHERLRAVVLATDGDWNTGLPPVQEALRYRAEQIPIFSVPIGSQSRLPDLELLSFDVPTFGVVSRTVRIPFTIESSLPHDQVVQLELKVSDGTILHHQVSLAAMGRTSDAILWKPETVGDYTLGLTIPALPEERNLENNHRETTIAIREEKLRVLVIESLPRWEYRYLRNALSRDPGVEVNCLLFHPGLSKVGGGNRDYISAFPEGLEELSQYDVVFLGDVGLDNGQLTEEQCRLLKGLVEQQASGLVFMPGFGGNMLSLVNSPLDALLPVVFDESQPTGWGSRSPSHFSLTELGRRSLLTKLADSEQDNLQVWENLPGFQWHAPIVRAKAGTDVLAVHQEQSNEYGRIPLLVTRTFGAGKVLFMGTDGAWRWRRGVEDLYHYRFWGQVVRWMAYQRNMAKGEQIRFYYSPEQPQVRQTVSLSANVMDKSGEPLGKGEVKATFVAPSGRTETVQLTGTGTEWGAFAGTFAPSEPGTYEVILRSKEAQAELKAKFFVQGALLEQIGKPARPEVLEELSRVTQGRTIASGQITEIIKALGDMPEQPPSIKRLQIWSHPLTAAILTGLLVVFWIGRKMVGQI